tara:strand:+ start:322 stop:834 length:513 start_codon:yes stop_codon:yes gene_type:complete
MTSFLNILGGSQEDTSAGADPGAGAGPIAPVAPVAQVEEADMGKSFDVSSLVGLIIEKGKDLLKHKMLLGWVMLCISGVVYLAYFKNTDPDDVAAEEALLGKNTEELMNVLNRDLNLTKIVKDKHLTSSSDDEEGEESEEGEGNTENKRIDELSNDLKELEEYTQESMDI